MWPAGAVGGALVVHEVEKPDNNTVRYDVRVYMEDGSYRTVCYATEPGYRIGDKVRIENGRLARGPSTV
jgi:outer membrane lipoprotein SlyB